MRLLAAFFLGLLFTVAYAEAGWCPGIDHTQRNLGGFQSLTVGAVVTSLTLPAGANYAILNTDGAALRYRDDGTDPTADVGHLMEDGESILICGTSLARFRMIADTATSATVQVSYYGN